ncbi:MAG: hypothetical protein IPP17_17655 [Bacteroidetes bacterium]|nr:hypothetical protein [Bacteroidota bacterium]
MPGISRASTIWSRASPTVQGTAGSGPDQRRRWRFDLTTIADEATTANNGLTLPAGQNVTWAVT